MERIEEAIRERKMLVSADLYGFEHDEGRIGIIDATPGRHEEADLYIQGVRSSTWIIPEGSPYHDAWGVGRFLMDNLLALADVRGWSVTAFPYTDGRLSDQDVYKWLKRKGFQGGKLIRPPQQPDMSQAIIKALNSKNRF